MTSRTPGISEILSRYAMGITFASEMRLRVTSLRACSGVGGVKKNA